MHGNAAAALHGQTCRLVQRDHGVILVDDHPLQLFDPGRVHFHHMALAWRRNRRGNLGHAQQIALGQARICLGPGAVEFDFPGSQQFLQYALGQAGNFAAQKPVQPHLGGFCGDGVVSHAFSSRNFAQ